MKIVIPTYARPDGQIDILEKGWIPESYYHNVYVCIRNSMTEYDRYQHLEKKVNLVPLDLPMISGIPEKRDAICRHFAGEKIWMCDDDIKIVSTYLKDDKSYIVKDKTLSEESFYELINMATGLLEAMPFGSVGTGFFPHDKKKHPIALNRWGAFNSFINLGKLTADDLGYTRVKYYEDIAAWLSAIDKGYNNFSLFKWLLIIGKEKGGGNVAARNEETMEEASKVIHSLYPEHIKLQDKIRDKKNNRRVYLKVMPKGVPKNLVDISQ